METLQRALPGRRGGLGNLDQLALLDSIGLADHIGKVGVEVSGEGLEEFFLNEEQQGEKLFTEGDFIILNLGMLSFMFFSRYLTLILMSFSIPQEEL